MSEQERGLFLFKNKSTGALKEIWMDLDYAFAETLIHKAELVNEYVALDTLPDPIEYDENICADCGFAHICIPDRIGTEVEIIDDSELLNLVNRFNELKPTAKEFDDIDKKINEMVRGREKILVGDWFIEGKWIDRKSYNIPQEIKDQHISIEQSWRKKIIPVGGNN